MFNQFSRYEAEFEQWVNDGYPGIKHETFDYIKHLSAPEDIRKPRAGTLWPHQWDAFLRVIYSYEIKRDDLAHPNGTLLNVVTGGGKTAIIAALIVWLRLAHDIRKSVIMCPNLIVKDRLEDDFSGGKVYRDRGLIPDRKFVTKDDFELTTLGSDRSGGLSSLMGASVILGNIHQFYTSNASGQSNLAALMNGPEFALFNDEAHNSPAPEWERTLQKMNPKVALRVDTTATPDRADGKTPDSAMIYEYSIQDALADRLVKTPVVYQPNIKTVELTYTDAQTGEKRAVEEIDWDEVDRKGINATQWVTDDLPMQQQMAIALRRLNEQQSRAVGRYHPLLFVVAVCKLDAQKAAKMLDNYFKIKTLLVTEDSSEDDRKKATELGRAARRGKPYRAVVSVMMLREGWDVPEVGVILLLRKFGSRVYGQQVIGRGLRRVRHTQIKDDEPQICSVVDHPKLQHQWLWDIFSSKIRSDVGIDDMFDETEDLPEPPPRQELDHPELMIDIPDPIEEEFEEFIIDIPEETYEAIKNWREVLESIAYPTQTVEITNQDIADIQGKELSDDGWTTHETMPSVNDLHDGGEDFENGFEPPDLQEAIKDELLNMSDRLLDHAGFAMVFKGDIYGILMQHIRTKFFDGYSIGLAEPQQLRTAWRNLERVEEEIISRPGLVDGMVKYGNK